jgi:hypothetical protein
MSGNALATKIDVPRQETAVRGDAYQRLLYVPELRIV